MDVGYRLALEEARVLDKDVATWLGKVVLILMVVGVVIGVFAGIVSSAFFPEFGDSTLFYLIIGGVCGLAATLVWRTLSRRGVL